MQVTRKLEFDAGHRVMNHESKCATPHGHRYIVEVSARPNDGLDDIGRVIDFSVLKDKLGTWIDRHWDHTMIIWEQDHQMISSAMMAPKSKEPWISPWNPTAENMADYLLHDLCPVLFAETKVTIFKIKIWETPNCYAEVEL